jgi:hypothetical protein
MATINLTAGRWVMGDRRMVSADSCSFCGWFGNGDCAPVACLLCDTVQCHRNGTGDGCCRVCHRGFLPGWSHIGREICYRRSCDQKAVGRASRGSVCKACAGIIKIRDRGQSLTLAAYAAERVAERDSGKGHYLLRWQFVKRGGA